MLQSRARVHALPSLWTQYLNVYGAVPPETFVENVMVVPVVVGLGRLLTMLTLGVTPTGAGAEGGGGVDVVVEVDEIEYDMVPIACGVSAVAPALRPHAPIT